jgi:L-threonylcarbamoyladenylate synthase
MKTELISADASDAIERALGVLRSGGVVAFPTDTVYGVGALITSPQSIARLFEVKGREQTKAIAVLIADASQLELVASHANEAAKKLAARFWPGALTLVLPKLTSLPAVLSPNDTIGVRVPDHAVARGLLAAAGPMAVTSANVSGGANALNANEVLAQLGGRIELVLDGGQTPGDRPSTVVDMTSDPPRVLREGPVTAAEIDGALGRKY